MCQHSGWKPPDPPFNMFFYVRNTKATYSKGREITPFEARRSKFRKMLQDPLNILDFEIQKVQG